MTYTPGLQLLPEQNNTLTLWELPCAVAGALVDCLSCKLDMRTQAPPPPPKASIPVIPHELPAYKEAPADAYSWKAVFTNIPLKDEAVRRKILQPFEAANCMSNAYTPASQPWTTEPDVPLYFSHVSPTAYSEAPHESQVELSSSQQQLLTRTPSRGVYLPYSTTQHIFPKPALCPIFPISLRSPSQQQQPPSLEFPNVAHQQTYSQPSLYTPLKAYLREALQKVDKLSKAAQTDAYMLSGGGEMILNESRDTENRKFFPKESFRHSVLATSEESTVGGLFERRENSIESESKREAADEQFQIQHQHLQNGNDYVVNGLEGKEIKIDNSNMEQRDTSRGGGVTATEGAGFVEYKRYTAAPLLRQSTCFVSDTASPAYPINTGNTAIPCLLETGNMHGGHVPGYQPPVPPEGYKELFIGGHTYLQGGTFYLSGTGAYLLGL